MSDSIPADLIKAIEEGRAVLLLGAGASFGATNTEGELIPLGEQLAAELITAYLGCDYEGLDFRNAYDLSCSQRDVATIQRFVHNRLSPFEPTDFHRLVTKFGWAGLITTNYDLIIEKSYKSVGNNAAQRIIPHTKDDDGATNQLDEKSVLYIKLHGCITRYQELDPPMIASTEQLIAFRDGRRGQFETFLEWSKNKTLVFVGYAFGDPNLRQLLDEVVRAGDKRPRHYIVDPLLLPAFSDYWRDRRFVTIKLGFEQFLKEIDRRISTTSRALSTLSAALSGKTTLSKFIAVSSRLESDSLVQYLRFGIDHITNDFDPPEEDVRRFYKGFDLGWLPQKRDLDVPRAVSDDILSEHVITKQSSLERKLVVLKGHAGSGKSVSLRRACWDAATTYGCLCLFVARDAIIKTELFDEIFSLVNNHMFLFVDGLSNHKRRVVELLSVAKSRKVGLTIVGAESFNTWNTSCEDIEEFVTNEHEMRNLSEKEIDQLIDKLEFNDSLGNLSTIPRDKRKEQFTVAYGRQILVALLEVTHGVPLIEIITKEYESIYPPEAKLLYLDICSLNRFGPPVRAGLISRIHDITFDDFRRRLFKPLEQIVHLRPDKKSGDFVYEARHSFIAEALFETVLTTLEERFDNFVRIIAKLNPSYSYDMEVLGRLLKADVVDKVVRDSNRARQVYDTAMESVGDLTFILHQRGIYELRVAKDISNLKIAGDFLERASLREPRNKSIKHSLAELDLRRSRLSNDELERLTWRRAAVARASDLTMGDTSPYPYHTLLKAATDDVSDALSAVEAQPNDAATQRLGDSIAHAEDVLRRGLQRFPNDQSLISGEGMLAEVLSNSKRAEDAFRKAFASNPRSTLIARRLVRILRAKNDVQACLQVLPKALEANPASIELHYDLARVLMSVAPDADQTNNDTITYHLRRSFVPKDRNYRAQFWYGRQLCLGGKFEDARLIYEHLSSLNMSFAERSKPQAEVKDNSGNNKRFQGTVVSFRGTFAFVQCADPKLEAFVGSNELVVVENRTFVEGTDVSFDLAFNFRGPVANRLSRIST